MEIFPVLLKIPILPTWVGLTRLTYPKGCERCLFWSCLKQVQLQQLYHRVTGTNPTMVNEDVCHLLHQNIGCISGDTTIVVLL